MVSAAFLSSQALYVKGSEGQDDTLFSSDVRLGRFPSFSCVSPFFFFPSLSNSSDKLSLSSAHMALGKNQCPHVSSAALHSADEG